MEFKNTLGMENVNELQSPCVDLLLSNLRDRNTGKTDFIFYSDRLNRILLEECLGLEPFKTTRRVTDTGSEYPHKELEFADRYCGVSILRAGDSMLGQFQHIFPHSPVGKILIQRNEESKEKDPIHLYSKLPKDISERRVLVLDPMCATGGSVCKAIENLMENGVKEENIVFVNLISVKEGLEKVRTTYPLVRIHTAKIDPELNDSKYIVPGLGDFGDKYFGTTL
eukprot:CAMPEP_0115007362 /NCGR_PEP_ID=MMETSP0216-20121206/21125_1 /TAXON_ID=223996 /ORGANISM="Protocruzia adherens, Strain Boccale" /LENGTH=224 /DNA_ID=CAMNT_0002374271 /DNA_START=74 /DNA_END=748 /DNA_ORIENTATION=-